MHESDFSHFSAMLDDVAAVVPPLAPLTSTGRAMFFRTLAHLPVEAVQRALDAHVRDPQRGRFFPKPADVLSQIPDTRPGADEGWAIAVKGRDESATIVWTDEIAQAWGIARPVMQLGDEVGARVAFRDAYNRLALEARQTGRPVNWMPSLGHDLEQRHLALHEAAVMGRIGMDQVTALLPPPELQSMPDHIRAQLQAVRDKLTGREPVVSEPSEDFREKQATSHAVIANTARVKAYAQKFGISLDEAQTLLDGGRGSRAPAFAGHQARAEAGR